MLDLMFLSRRLPYVIAGGLIGAFLLAVLGCSFSMMPMHAGSLDIAACSGTLHLTPYLVSPKDHVFGQFFSLLIVSTLFSFTAWSFTSLLYSALAPPLQQYFFKQRRILALLHDYLLIGFQRGILHAKIY